MNPAVLAGMSIAGLAVGGFLNLNIDRIPRGQPVFGRSVPFCDYCQRRLSPLDLVPLVEYLWPKGKCRECGAALPLRHLMVQVATAVLFALVVYRFEMAPLTGVILAYGSLFLAIIAIDMEWTIIPNVLVLPGSLLALALAPIGPVGEERALGEAYISVAAGGALGFGAMFFIWLVSVAIKSKFGMGDLKLGLLIGLVIGFPEVAVPLYFASLLGGVVALFLLLLKLRERRDVIPYGPFLAGAALVALLIGEPIGWYLDFVR